MHPFEKLLFVLFWVLLLVASMTMLPLILTCCWSLCVASTIERLVGSRPRVKYASGERTGFVRERLIAHRHEG